MDPRLPTKSHLAAEADSEVAAIEGGGGICTADFLVGHRVFLTRKTCVVLVLVVGSPTQRVCDGFIIWTSLKFIAI